MNNEQRELAEYMSFLSEDAFCAGWMDGLEFGLWKGMNNEIEEYERLKFTDEIVEKLKELSLKAKGWIVFDDVQEESFLPWEMWNARLDSNM
ncbi:MAG: hypothetical protein AAFX53_18545 [Bacteroidota bacterium]